MPTHPKNATALFFFPCAWSGTLAQKAVLQGFGVGDATATAAAATMTHLLRDATSKVGKIWFTWAQGSDLDNNAKQWRLVADILNDFAICVELMAPAFPLYFVALVCLASTCKAIVGVAGGATRYALTQHQARQNNIADVSAKDGSQETLVELSALLCSYFVVPLVGDSAAWTWVVFSLFTALHVYSNYNAVCSLKLDQFNRKRAAIAIRAYVLEGEVPSPADVACKEAIFSSSTDGVDLELGCSLRSAIDPALLNAQIQRGAAASLVFLKPSAPGWFAPAGARLHVQVVFHASAAPRDELRVWMQCCLVEWVHSLDVVNATLLQLKQALAAYVDASAAILQGSGAGAGAGTGTGTTADGLPLCTFADAVLVARSFTHKTGETKPQEGHLVFLISSTHLPDVTEGPTWGVTAGA